jgi:hypothetical protein
MSTLKVDTITTISGTGNINLSRPLSGSGASLTSLPAANLTGVLPAIDGSSLTGVAPTKAAVEALGIELPAANLTGTVAGARLPDPLPAIDGSSLTGVGVTDAKFLVLLNGQLGNCTGNGENVNLLGAIWTEVYDTSNSFNTTNGYFTAPETGKYLLTGGMSLTGVSSSHTWGKWSLVTSNRTFYGAQFHPYNTALNGNDWRQTTAWVVDMDINDTAYMQIQIHYTNTTVDVSTDLTYFSGALLA